MVFSSNIFLFLFLPLTLGGYYLLRGRGRNYFLLLASLIFYAWGGHEAIFILLASIAVNYLGGILLELADRRGAAARLSVLIATICADLALLFYYKYYNFAVGSIDRLLGASIPLRDIVLPIGISFFTFQGMSYVIDLYRRQVSVQKNPLYAALYISLFPQLIAGPIVRYRDIEKQIDERQCGAELFWSGVQRFVIGLGKKVLLANNVALVADGVFAMETASLPTVTAWLGVICYTLQIYFDFSGYSDMAIGLGRMFGFQFLENFNHPYISTSVREFWRRWHISLSTWFRDYLYIPLGGNRRGNTYVNLIIVFLTTGLWHGASWNFVFWGLWHGAFLIAERLLLKRGRDVGRYPALGWVYTALVVMLGWVVFRAPGLRYAIGYIGALFAFRAGTPSFTGGFINCRTMFFMAASALCCLPLGSWLPKVSERWRVAAELAGAALIFALLLLCATQILTSAYNPFIYFRF